MLCSVEYVETRVLEHLVNGYCTATLYQATQPRIEMKYL